MLDCVHKLEFQFIAGNQLGINYGVIHTNSESLLASGAADARTSREAAFSHLHLMRMNAKDTVKTNNSRALGTLDGKSMGSCDFMALQQGHVRFVSPRTQFTRWIFDKFKNTSP